MKRLDCTGQRFGYLTVLGASGRSPTNVPLWKLQCDCGNIVEKPLCCFAYKPNPSCGCRKRLRWLELNQKRGNADCTGQRFGRLVVLGKGDRIPDRGSYRQLWRLQCDCGKVIQKSRGDFEYGKQKSCGCHKGDRGRAYKNITGMKFGTLTALDRTGKDNCGKPTWLMQCDCGGTREISLSRIRSCEYYGIRINCGSRKHPERYLKYPPIPVPYPKESGELLIKYLHLTELDYQQINSAVEDEKRDRLIRACWILTCRRSRGENISELHEARYIRKSLRFASIDVFWERKIEQHGGLLYTASEDKKDIGIGMTHTTSLDYPVIQTQGIKHLSTNTNKHLKFRRC